MSEPIEIECPTCGALCLQHEGGYEAIESGDEASEWASRFKQAAEHVAVREATIATLRAALLWYGDATNHELVNAPAYAETPMQEDRGERARVALAKVAT